MARGLTAPSGHAGSRLLRLGIEASNIRAGGGVTHLVELLSAANPQDHGIGEVRVWSGRRTLEQLPSRPWLRLMHDPALDGGLLARFKWQRTTFDRVAAESCELLFVPGGIYLGSLRPFVAMSQNLLPFDSTQRRRYGLSSMGVKLRLLNRAKKTTFRKAAGVIFLTERGRADVMRETGPLKGATVVIGHGFADHLAREPPEQRPLSSYSMDAPFRWLYVSTVEAYKHQSEVVQAVAGLRQSGLPVGLDLIGPGEASAVAGLREVMTGVDPRGEYIRYHGRVPRDELTGPFHSADAFIFASSCESFGIILVDAMAAGLPIACSARSVMPEVLGDAGTYFDPEDVASIAGALHGLMSRPLERARYAALARERARRYTWAACAAATFGFIGSVGHRDPGLSFQQRAVL